MHLRARFAVVVLLWLLAGPQAVLARSPLGYSGILSSAEARPYRELRYEGVIGQTEWYTCGPAALATLLHVFYGVDTDEASVLGRTLEVMAAQGQSPTRGISALALLKAADGYGFAAAGYRVEPEALADYFRRGGPPLILHVTVPEHHYVVAVGLVDEYIVAADPSWGRRIEPLQSFLNDKGFSGVALLFQPPEELKPIGQSRQKEALQRAAARLAGLQASGRAGR